MPKVLIIDDDHELLNSVQMVLKREGFIADVADCLEEADALLGGFAFDLIILDWNLPDGEGIDYLARLRKTGVHVPIIMLTGQHDVEKKIAGLDGGADDYLTKPFNRVELVSRIRAVLRRPQVMETTVLSGAGVVLDTRALKVTWQGAELKLTKQEYQLLELLMRHKGEVFSHNALVERAWSTMSESSPDTVRVHMSRLRKKFENGAAECPIRTVHGQGYVFDEDQ